MHEADQSERMRGEEFEAIISFDLRGEITRQTHVIPYNRSNTLGAVAADDPPQFESTESTTATGTCLLGVDSVLSNCGGSSAATAPRVFERL